MKEILELLDGSQQYIVLDRFFNLFLPDLGPVEKPELIQKVMDSINESKNKSVA